MLQLCRHRKATEPARTDTRSHCCQSINNTINDTLLKEGRSYRYSLSVQAGVLFKIKFYGILEPVELKYSCREKDVTALPLTSVQTQSDTLSLCIGGTYMHKEGEAATSRHTDT